MGREVRKIKRGWQHPSNGYYGDGSIKYIPLHEGFGERLSEWNEGKAKWNEGLMWDYETEGYIPKDEDCTWEEYECEKPDKNDYMPDWTEEEKELFVMYENVSEGTPISPPFETVEQLARWLADTGASSGGYMTASYEQWLNVCKDGYTPTMVLKNGIFMSGVEATSLVFNKG